MQISDMERLFYGEIVPGEKYVPQTQKYDDTMKFCKTAEKELLGQVQPYAADLFEDYKTYANKLTVLQNEEMLHTGVGSWHSDDT
ncbi:MAG: hypothetical protein LUD16_12260 [Lachnospiraceae bacterium]|nr:hypothetical protein [Lachnospiraceae bacterium]